MASGNQVKSESSDKVIFLLKSTYQHDYRPLDKPNCTEGIHIVSDNNFRFTRSLCRLFNVYFCCLFVYFLSSHSVINI